MIFYRDKITGRILSLNVLYNLVLKVKLPEKAALSFSYISKN